MAAPYTLKQLTDVKDSAPDFGLGEFQEARFAKDAVETEEGLEMIAFGPRHDGDGEVLENWWTD